MKSTLVIAIALLICVIVAVGYRVIMKHKFEREINANKIKRGQEELEIASNPKDLLDYKAAPRDSIDVSMRRDEF